MLDKWIFNKWFRFGVVCLVAFVAVILAIFQTNSSLNQYTTNLFNGASADIIPATNPATVLVVANQNNQASIDLANYYISKRAVPISNLLLVNYLADDNAYTISQADFTAKLATPITNKIATLSHIDYILLIRNLPYKITGVTGSVDSVLANVKTGTRMFIPRSNPYYNKTGAFSSAQYNMYLVNRLDGWSWTDAKALVDNSVTARRSANFWLQSDPSKGAGYSFWNTAMTGAVSLLSTNGIRAVKNNNAVFTAPTNGLLGGYISWGSNHKNYWPAGKTVIQNLKFVPGAISEVAVSGSGAHLRKPAVSGEQWGIVSNAADFIHDGVTGTKGYIDEPYLDAIAMPDILLGRYTSGRNLAESFYAASRRIGWQDMVIGDPLCAPYRNTGGVTYSPPIITTQPQNKALVVGARAAFFVTATGTAPLTYQWQKNNVNISGATLPNYSTPVVTLADNGSTYRVVVTNQYGTVTSNLATLSVGVAPTISSHPQSATVAAGANVTFSVTASGTAILSYQWQKNGVDIAGATAPTYQIPTVTSAMNNTTYRAVITNSFGTAISNTTTLKIISSDK